MVGVARGLRQAVAGDAGQREFDGGLETHAVANGDSFTAARVRTTAPMVGTSSSTPRWLAMPKRRGIAMPWPSQRMRSGVIFSLAKARPPAQPAARGMPAARACRRMPSGHGCQGCFSCMWKSYTMLPYRPIIEIVLPG